MLQIIADGSEQVFLERQSRSRLARGGFQRVGQPLLTVLGDQEVAEFEQRSVVSEADHGKWMGRRYKMGNLR